MQSLLRRVVAGPRQPHQEANLDLCYVTDFLIATSGPSVTYPQRAYRNPLDQLVKFLDDKHGENWAIWEFRAEGTGYPDSEVYGRIHHYPWPDHHPPPFRLVPLITASMRDWLHPQETGTSTVIEQGNGKVGKGGNGIGSDRVVVVHCKAGKGRSGTSAIAYLMSEEGWTKSAALSQFTVRRMRPNFGAGVSIPSQLRYLDYTERWVENGKMYVEQAVEVLEVQIWGLRDGIRVAVEGFVDEGKEIKSFHVFDKSEREDFEDGGESGRLHTRSMPSLSETGSAFNNTSTTTTSSTTSNHNHHPLANLLSSNVFYRPHSSIYIPGSDINLAIERRSRAASYGGFTMVTSIAHVWFNVFFEGNGPERYAKAAAAAAAAMANGEVPGAPWAEQSGVFEIAWDAMDGIKGSNQKGVKAFDKVAVVWRIASAEGPSSSTSSTTTQPNEASGPLPTTNEAESTSAHTMRPRTNSTIIVQPPPGSPIPESAPAMWDGTQRVNNEKPTEGEEIATSFGVASRHGHHRLGVGEEVESGTGGGEGEVEDSSDEEGGIRRGVVE